MANENRAHELRGKRSGAGSLALLYGAGALFVVGALVAGGLAIYAAFFH